MAADNSGTDGEGSDVKQVPVPASISCSVCLEIITEAGERSVAKLKCGHDFHLDCIGSAFNAKGVMQCPNCRQVELGQWLYANGGCLQDDFMEDITYEDDYEVYGGMPNLVSHPDEMFGQMPWCPFQGAYQHFPISLEENNIRANSARGFFMGGPWHYSDDHSTLHAGQISRGDGITRSLGFPSRDGNLWLQQASTSSSNSAVSGGGTRNLSSEARPNFSRSNTNRPRGPGFYIQSLDLIHSGVHQGLNHGNIGAINPENRGLGLNQFQPLVAGGSSGPNGYTGRRLRRSAAARLTSQRAAQLSSLEHRTLVSARNWGQSSGDQLREDVGWQADNSVESWIRGQAYAAQGPLQPSHHWWPWAPPTGGSTQHTLNTVSSGHHDGQFYGSGSSLQRANSPSYGHQTATGLMWPPCGFHSPC